MEKICTRTWSSFDRQIKSSLRRHHALCTRAKKAIKKRKKNRDKRKRHHVVAGENRRCRRRSVPSSKKKETSSWRRNVSPTRRWKKNKKTTKTTGKNAWTKPREKIRRLPQNSPLFLFDDSNDREKKQRWLPRAAEAAAQYQRTHLVPHPNSSRVRRRVTPFVGPATDITTATCVRHRCRHRKNNYSRVKVSLTCHR